MPPRFSHQQIMHSSRIHVVLPGQFSIRCQPSREPLSRCQDLLDCQFRHVVLSADRTNRMRFATVRVHVGRILFACTRAQMRWVATFLVRVVGRRVTALAQVPQNLTWLDFLDAALVR
jgi:hypothetical protein